MKIAIIGNGILSLMTAFRLVQSNQNLEITIIGPNNREGCATLAAPAMLNSYAELIKGSLDTSVDREKFQISRLAGKQWEKLFSSIHDSTEPKPEVKNGTYVLNNTTTDCFDDSNIDAITGYLDEFDEPYEIVNPIDIPGYQPAAQQRAIRAIYIPNERFVNSEAVLQFLDHYLASKGVSFIDAKVEKLISAGNQITRVKLDDERIIDAKKFVLAPGANFSKIVEQSQLNLSFQKILYGSGVSIELETPKPTIQHCVRTPNRGFACGIYSAPRHDNQVFIGASNHVATFPLMHGMAESVSNLLKSSMEQINADFFRAGFLRTRVGWRPTSVDSYPLIGPCRMTNLMIATGTKRDGFHMSPMISEYIASLCLEQEYEHAELFKSFHPERSVIKNIPRAKAIEDIVNHEVNAYYQHGFVPDKGSMLMQHRQMLTKEAIEVHDRLGLKSWGIPPEIYPIFRGGHENLLGGNCFRD